MVAICKRATRPRRAKTRRAAAKAPRAAQLFGRRQQEPGAHADFDANNFVHPAVLPTRLWILLKFGKRSPGQSKRVLCTICIDGPFCSSVHGGKAPCRR
eukprot:CAMPEP_0119342102 /NCGR_PEP_ID=MMETSP1333-20130426/104005_1 /TAXON_ID=418940 /ORGANISM="Scyphosphaera apsteinii, Strain RCC1455" /LENGTH=98 /DNA_ID=CAMNT_0007354249 /DNA_START=303 /DNA_END=599 /DNA_ORIENTATION=-